jgi:hypothetical protein
MRKIYPLALLTVLLLSLLTPAPAMAACYINCGDGEECTGFPVCCCVYDEFGTWAYCGRATGNPCGGAAAISTKDDSLQASYAAIFSAASPEAPGATSSSK